VQLADVLQQQPQPAVPDEPHRQLPPAAPKVPLPPKQQADVLQPPPHPQPPVMHEAVPDVQPPSQTAAARQAGEPPPPPRQPQVAQPAAPKPPCGQAAAAVPLTPVPQQQPQPAMADEPRPAAAKAPLLPEQQADVLQPPPPLPQSPVMHEAVPDVQLPLQTAAAQQAGEQPPPPPRQMQVAQPVAPKAAVPAPPRRPPPPVHPRAWTKQDAESHPTRIGLEKAHKFLRSWRKGGTDGTEFDWLGYVAGGEYMDTVFSSPVVRFEIRYLLPIDTNTTDHRCDFLAHQQNGLAVRLHPSRQMDAMPVRGYPGPWYMTWKMDGDPMNEVNTMYRIGRHDPAAPRGQHTQGECFMNFSVADKISAKSFNTYMKSYEPHDVTHPHATQGHVCLAHPFATHEPLMPLLRMQIRRVWACLTNEDERGLLVEGQGDQLILVKCELGKFVYHAEREVLATVVVPW